jgi:N-acetylglutamate synthase-like GNAT family acetyltransferase
MDTSSTSIRVADANVSVPALVLMINAAYKVGESGIMLDSPEHPFTRTNTPEVQGWIAAEKLLIAIATTGRVIGCVKVEKLSHEPTVGLWGCLAVDSAFAGQGVGSLLVAAVRTHLHLNLRFHNTS